MKIVFQLLFLAEIENIDKILHILINLMISIIHVMVFVLTKQQHDRFKQ